jgi:hypothetical protein
LNWGHDTMKTPSSSVSIMMGTWIDFIYTSSVFMH